MSNLSGRSRRRARRTFSLEFLEERRLLAYGAPGPVFDLGLPASEAFRDSSDYSGRVTIVWNDDDGSGEGVYARQFESSGQAVGEAFLVNQETTGDQISPRIFTSSYPDETLIVWWSDSQLYYRGYDLQGAPLGDARPLEGTQGISTDFEIAGADEEGFTIYAQGFRFYRFDLDGSQVAATTLDPAEEGWTAVESTDPARAKLASGDHPVVAWSQYRERQEGDQLVYDVRIMATLLEDDLSETLTLVMAEEDGLADLDVATGMNPLVPGGGTEIVAWWSEASFGPVIRARELVTGRYGDLSQYEAMGDVLQFGNASDGVPTAISGRSSFEVHFVRPGETGDSASYFRVWTPFRSLPYVVVSTWTEGPEVPTSDAAPGSFQSISLQPVVAEDFWLIRVDTAGVALAQRFASTEANLLVRSGTDVKESAGQVLVRFYRTGDLSQPLTFDYHTTSDEIPPWLLDDGETVAIPGVDYTSVSGVVAFEAGQSEVIVSVPILDDDILNGVRIFRLLGVDPTTGEEVKRSIIYILDDEVPPNRNDLAVFDYGAAGIRGYDAVDGWLTLSDRDPVQLLATPDRTVLADFGADGLWAWAQETNWHQINDVSPQSMIFGAGRVFLDYGQYGLWSWTEEGEWAQLNDVDPMTMSAVDETLYVDFAIGGFWSWTADGGYTPISLDGPHPEALTSYDGTVYIDYGASGLWSWGLDAGWAQINPADPKAMVVGSEGLFIDYGSFGLWRWDAENGIQQLTEAAPRSLAIADGSFLASFAPGGFWQWTALGRWQPYSKVAPVLIAATPRVTNAVIDFGSGGVWRWDPIGTTWLKLSDVSPQTIVRM